MCPTIKQKLFIITGASGVGKSTVCEILFRNETRYIVMESDLLWNNAFNTPEDNYNSYRRLWLRVCANISQIGIPVVLCGCAIPEQFELTEERGLFSELHYLAIVCDDDSLISRMRKGRDIRDNNWIESSLDFNRWLIRNAESCVPPIRLLNTEDRPPEQAAGIIDKWICERL